MTGHGQYKLLGKTIDDAAGEAFDKAARILGLGYPGGPAIQKAAEAGDPERFAFPRAWLKGTLDFSFSGLKAALLRKVQEYGVTASKPAPWQQNPAAAQEAIEQQAQALARPDEPGKGFARNDQAGRPEHFHRGAQRTACCSIARLLLRPNRRRLGIPEHLPESSDPTNQSEELPVADLAASFQAAVVDALVEKTITAATEYGAREVLVAGGVAANLSPQAALGRASAHTLSLPASLLLCTDNAAMIAAAAYYALRQLPTARFCHGYRAEHSLRVGRLFVVGITHYSLLVTRYSLPFTLQPSSVVRRPSSVVPSPRPLTTK